ncbi:MAG TPA: hypothetical protein VHC90_06510 [Bryobacteraceae bacterium]|nr:hypothetical protein [Bryobacteraceae bacterium]
MARPRKTTNNNDIDILRYALTHLERERDEILQKIAHITHQLGDKIASYTAPAAPAASTAAAPRKKRVLSAAARKRIAAAQKKRWEAHRKAKAQ